MKFLSFLILVSLVADPAASSVLTNNPLRSSEAGSAEVFAREAFSSRLVISPLSSLGRRLRSLNLRLAKKTARPRRHLRDWLAGRWTAEEQELLDVELAVLDKGFGLHQPGNGYRISQNQVVPEQLKFLQLRGRNALIYGSLLTGLLLPSEQWVIGVSITYVAAFGLSIYHQYVLADRKYLLPIHLPRIMPWYSLDHRNRIVVQWWEELASWTALQENPLESVNNVIKAAGIVRRHFLSEPPFEYWHDEGIVEELIRRRVGTEFYAYLRGVLDNRDNDSQLMRSMSLQQVLFQQNVRISKTDLLAAAAEGIGILLAYRGMVARTPEGVSIGALRFLRLIADGNAWAFAAGVVLMPTAGPSPLGDFRAAA